MLRAAVGFRCIAALLAAALMLAAPTAGRAAPEAAIPITVATLRVAGEGPLFIALDRGYFKAEGLDVDLQFGGDAATNIMLTSTGKADVFTGSVSPGLWNVVGRGVPIKLVMPIGSVSDRPGSGFTSGEWLVLSKKAARTVKTLADLRGKNIAVPGFGLSGDVFLDHALVSGGLTRHDVTVKSLPMSSIPAALANGSVDAAVLNDPFVTTGSERGLLVPWKNASAIYPGQVLAVVAFGPQMLSRAHDVGVHFATALLRATRDYNAAFGPKHVDFRAVAAIVAKYAGDTDAALYSKLSWNYVDPNCALNVKALEVDLSWYSANGFVAQPPNPSQVVDSSYCAAAVKALGPYKPR